MSDAPDVSVLIVNWNGLRVLGNCLQSLRTGQQGVTTEVIVVDNDSSDGSPDIIPRDFPEVRLIRNQDNRGFAAGNNQAAAAAKGRFLFFLNNDTVVSPGALAKLAGFLDKHRGVVAVGPRLIGSDGKPQRSGRDVITLRAILHQSVLPVKWSNIFAKQYRAYRHSFDAEKSGAVPQLAAAALLVKREAFQQAGEWDEGFRFGVEDVDLCVRLRAYGEIYYFGEVQITHLGRVSSHLNRGWVLQGYLCGYVLYFRKHHLSTLAPLIYKLAITLDAPIRLFSFFVKALTSRLTGHAESSEKSAAKARAVWFFLTRGLLQFWRS